MYDTRSMLPEENEPQRGHGRSSHIIVHITDLQKKVPAVSDQVMLRDTV